MSEETKNKVIKEIEDFDLNYKTTISHANLDYLFKTIEAQRYEIERLNNIIKDIKGQLNYLETYSSKEDVFEDMKRRLDRIESIVNRK